MFLIPIPAVAGKYPWLLHDGKRAAAVDPGNAGPVFRPFEKHALPLESILGACRAWVVEIENRPQRGQFLPDLQAHSPAMGQKDGKKWTAVVDLQPTIPKSDRLLGRSGTKNAVKQGGLSNVGAVTSEVTAKVLLHKPIAIQRAIAIRFCNAKSL